jgi:hypothetical protein
VVEMELSLVKDADMLTKYVPRHINYRQGFFLVPYDLPNDSSSIPPSPPPPLSLSLRLKTNWNAIKRHWKI